MSKLSDARYRQPQYECFREIVRAWCDCGGIESLAVQFEVPESTVELWHNGRCAPSPKIRDQVICWISSKTMVTTFECFRCGKRRAHGYLRSCPKDDRQWCDRDGDFRQDNASGPGT